MDQMIKQQEDLNQETTDQKWNQFFQKTYWNKYTKLGESWKWNDEDIDQNTMDQMIKQREDFDQNQEVRIQNERLIYMPLIYILITFFGDCRWARVSRISKHKFSPCRLGFSTTAAP